MKKLWIICLLALFANSADLTSEQLQLLQQFQTQKRASEPKFEQTQIVTNQINATKQTNEIKANELKVKQIKKQKTLTRYGSLFFNNQNKINPYATPTPQNYKITNDDVLSLKIYGATNESLSLHVNRDGNIEMPNIGMIKVIGLGFDEAKELLLKKAKQAYPNSTNILINIEKFSPIQITLSGLVKNPGFLNLSSFSTIKDALLQSGGLQDVGSFRNIKLIRANKIIATFDLYSLIRYGKSNNTPLQNGDIVLVEPVKKQVKLQGAISNEAIYELKQNESFKELFAFASNFLPNANKQAISLKRIQEKGTKVYTLSLNELYKFTPQNGDEIIVYKISPKNANLVSIVGNIIAPSEQQIPKNGSLHVMLKKLLDQFGKNAYFLENTNYEFASIENDGNFKSFNLNKILQNKYDIKLKKGDKITIYKNDEFKQKPYIFVRGDVIDESKIKYEFKLGLVAKDLFDIIAFKTQIAQANESLDDDEKIIYKPLQVDTQKVQINRVKNNKKLSFIVVGSELENFKLKAYDEVRFFDFLQTNEPIMASIQGEVYVPGVYYINENATLKDILKLSGGLTRKALKGKFELARYSVKNNKRVRQILNLDLNKDLNFHLQADDEIIIFPIANWSQRKYVTLKGMVKFPGVYPIEEGEKLFNVVQRAGGFNKNAFIEGAVFTRKSVQILQEKRLQESIDRIKKQVAHANLTAKQAGEDSNEKAKLLGAVKQIEKESQLNKPIGRISMHLYYDLQRFQTSRYNITLEDGDMLFIPPINDTVSVVGEVLNQNTFVYIPDKSIEDYIQNSGGFGNDADEDLIYVVKANGEAQKYEKSYFWNNHIDIFKGDTIVVPIKIQTISNITLAKDVTSIIYQLAVTAASLKTLGAL